MNGVDLMLLEKLCMTDGVSGNEKAVREEIISLLLPDCSYRTDPLGNLIVEKKGAKTPENKVAIFAHLDEVGFMVSYIEDNGYIRLAPVGGIEDSAVFGKKITVNGKTGVVGGKAVHQLSTDEAKKIPGIDEVCADFGFESREEAEQYMREGDFGCFKSDFVRFGDGFIKSKALDDRAGCAVLLELLRELSDFDYTAVFTVQEEVGTRGAAVSAFTVRPDFAVVVESTTASDIPDVPEHKKVCRAGGGAVVSFMDRATLYDRDLYRLALKTAKENNIDCQVKKAVAGGNDAGAIHKAAGGIRTIAVSVPCRYIHSASSVCRESDIDSVKELAGALIKELADG